MNNNYYQFTAQERKYFDQLQQNFNTGVQSGVQMLITQQDLQGQWQIAQDGKGLQRVDQQRDQPMRAQTLDVDSTPNEKVNGVA